MKMCSLAGGEQPSRSTSSDLTQYFCINKVFRLPNPRPIRFVCFALREKCYWLERGESFVFMFYLYGTGWALMLQHYFRLSFEE